MAEEAGGRSAGWSGVWAVLLPGLVTVLGLQAWRAGLVLLRDGGAPAAVAAGAPFLLLPSVRARAAARGARRTAAELALGLAALRLAVQLGGPLTAGWYALVGVALFAGYLDAWSAAPGSPRQAVQALLLGFNLSLLDRVFTDTHDLCWRAGGGALAAVVVAALPVILLAGHAWLTESADRPEAGPLAVALPMVVVLVQLGLGHLSRVAALTGWSVPVAGLYLIAGNVLAVVVGTLYDWLHLALLRRRSRARTVRAVYWSVGGGVAALVAGGLAWRPLLATALLAGPSLIAVALVPLLRARPVGRRRQLGQWSVVWAWWLAAAAAAAAMTAAWPVAVTALLLFALAAPAVIHQRRPEPEPVREARWPLLAHLLIAVTAGLALVRVPGAGTDLYFELHDGAARVVSLDLSRWETTRRPGLEGSLAALRRVRGQVIVLRGLAGAYGGTFHDSAFWLGRRLGLNAATAPGVAGRLAVLAPVSPSVAAGPRPDLLVVAWRLADSALGLAGCASPAALPAADQALGDYPRRIICGPLGPAASLPGYTRARSTGAPDLLLVGPGIAPVPVRDTVRLTEPGGTALLEIRP